jgi:hypothetical protein
MKRIKAFSNIVFEAGTSAPVRTQRGPRDRRSLRSAQDRDGAQAQGGL